MTLTELDRHLKTNPKGSNSPGVLQREKQAWRWVATGRPATEAKFLVLAWGARAKATWREILRRNTWCRKSRRQLVTAELKKKISLVK